MRSQVKNSVHVPADLACQTLSLLVGDWPCVFFAVRKPRMNHRMILLVSHFLAVAFGDKPAIEHGPKFPDAMCPLFTFAKHPKQLNILIPSGEFIKTAYDDWVERVLKDPTGGVPWEQKEERAVGRWTLFENVHYTDRFGRESQHIRQEHIEHSNATGYKYTSCMSPGAVGGRMALSEQRKFK
jgi:hypothetical protein